MDTSRKPSTSHYLGLNDQILLNSKFSSMLRKYYKGVLREGFISDIFFNYQKGLNVKGTFENKLAIIEDKYKGLKIPKVPYLFTLYIYIYYTYTFSSPESSTWLSVPATQVEFIIDLCYTYCSTIATMHTCNDCCILHSSLFAW